VIPRDEFTIAPSHPREAGGGAARTRALRAIAVTRMNARGNNPRRRAASSGKVAPTTGPAEL